jgi:hypothetical protein
MNLMPAETTVLGDFRTRPHDSGNCQPFWHPDGILAGRRQRWREPSTVPRLG